ncbi:TPA: hypothetical protein N0F65_011111 [Lagenidium giganteum]|uniref:Uncharacterized protein n=1 Tax=Lagenidium giganteum TaxID=4803 RepID=A0AAV2ZIL0_9STRA|nr:TPA: hypothetical protein N0F65_011111 [Lagenidium giganteum]
MRLIGATLPTDKFQQVDHLTTGTNMWESTCEIYEKRSDPTIRESIIVKKSDELQALKCSRAEDIDVHLARMFRLRTELAGYNYNVHDINMKEMMLKSLPDLYEFEQLRRAIKGVFHTLLEQLLLTSEQPTNDGAAGRANEHGVLRGAAPTTSSCSQKTPHTLFSGAAAPPTIHSNVTEVANGMDAERGRLFACLHCMRIRAQIPRSGVIAASSQKYGPTYQPQW